VKVSVVIPTYYRPKDLADLFDSLLRQTVKPMEVIVVDDTPVNVIERLCEKYYDKFKKLNIELFYVRNHKEPSLTIARNIGVSIAKGDIILFLDSDVVLHSNYVEKILEVFKDNLSALGVQGWRAPKISQRGSKRLLKHFVLNSIRKLFLVQHFSVDRCNLFEYPLILTRVTNCQYLSGSNMAFRRIIFNEFKFDENLLKYAYLEDLLFTHSIYKKYPNSLYITPYAKYIHKVSEEGRIYRISLLEDPFLRVCRKYVLMKLFGVKGLIIFGWQTLGLLALSISRNFLEIYNSIARNKKINLDTIYLKIKSEE